jgi:O-methyltransferase
MNLFRLLRSWLPLELKPPADPLKKILVSLGYFRWRTRLAGKGSPTPELDLYRPLYSPWEGSADFLRYYGPIRPHTLVSPDRCWILLSFMRHALALTGDFAEFGVFRGGTALLAAEILAEAHDPRTIHLFDSFAGMPETSAGEAFGKGDFSRTSEAAVQALMATADARVAIHAGFIPDSFRGLGLPRLAFAHVDVDLYQSVLDCIEFVYPRLVPGGILIFDDYGFPSCARSREAVDRAFATRRERPVYLPTGQTLVIKLP